MTWLAGGGSCPPCPIARYGLANNTLETLEIYGNKAITGNGLMCLVEPVSRHSGMEELVIPYYLGVDKMSKTINEARKRNGLPDIVIRGW